MGVYALATTMPCEWVCVRACAALPAVSDRLCAGPALPAVSQAPEHSAKQAVVTVVGSLSAHCT